MACVQEITHFEPFKCPHVACHQVSILPYYGSVTTPFVAAALILVTSQIDPLPPVIREAVLPVRLACID